MPRPNTPEQIFTDVFSDIRSLEKRFQNFETWEPLGTARKGAHAYRTTNTTLTAGAYRVLIFDTEFWESDSTIYDTTTGTFTVPTTGLYLVTSKMSFTGFVGTVTYKVQNLTTTAYQDTEIVDASLGRAKVSTLMEFTVGDTFNIQAFSASNINVLSVAGNPYQTYGSAQLVST